MRTGVIGGTVGYQLLRRLGRRVAAGVDPCGNAESQSKLEALFGPYPPADPHEDLVAIGEELAKFLGDFMPTFLKVVAHPLADADRLRDWHGTLPFAPILAGLTARIERMKRDGLVGDVSAEMTAFTLVSAAHGVALFGTMASHHERATRNPTMRGVVDTLFKGVMRRGPAPTGRKRSP